MGGVTILSWFFSKDKLDKRFCLPIKGFGKKFRLHNEYMTKIPLEILHDSFTSTCTHFNWLGNRLAKGLMWETSRYCLVYLWVVAER